MFGICNLSVVPVRKEPSDRSEIVTQLLFGDQFEIKDKQKQWRRIITTYDDYEGWIDEKQFLPLEFNEHHALLKAGTYVAKDLVQVMSNSGRVFPVLLGSSFPAYKDKGMKFAEEEFLYEGQAKLMERSEDKNTLVENAFLYLNAPYLWGGRSPFGIDCSGFTQMVFKLNGIVLKRDAYLQAEQGLTLNFLEEAKAGDLAFFDNEEGRIIHVGIVLSENKIIHASGKVRIDRIDHQGIFNVETRRYTHQLRVIKRLL